MKTILVRYCLKHLKSYSDKNIVLDNVNTLEKNTENARVANLMSYRILDTPSEREFDDLVRLAAVLCDAPIAMMSLIDDHRQWCKARWGIEVSEFPLEQSLCAHAVHSGKDVVVTDATFDKRFSQYPLIAGGPKFRFYVGVPLISREGYALGALCVVDYNPRQIDIQKLNLLKMLANQVVSVMERNRYADQVEVQRGMLKASSRLASLGQMAASIVHEINNPLSILQARASMLAMQSRDGKTTSESAAEAAEKMLETTRRMNKIIGGLSSSLGNSDHEPYQEVSINQIIEETLSFTAGRFASGQIDFQYTPPTEVSRIYCRPVQISQVILNLLNNAYDAVSANRTKQRWVRLEVRSDHAAVEISITDSGKPISSEVIQKIFTPFFTTKEAGKGTGLGLSIASEIVDQHGGQIKCDTESRNTRFTVRLPKRQVMLVPVLNQ